MATNERSSCTVERQNRKFFTNDRSRFSWIVLSLLIAHGMLFSCTILIIGASAFSTAGGFYSTIRMESKLNGNGYEFFSVQDAHEKFDAWSRNGNACSNSNTILEYIVREEDLKNSGDGDGHNIRNNRVSHFAARIFPDSLPTTNAANVACSQGSLTVNSNKVSGGKILQNRDILVYNNTRIDRRTAIPSDPLRAERFCASRLKLLQTLGNKNLTHSPLSVLYEDRCVAIVCKPAGIHTMSWSGSFGKSLCLDEILPLMLTPPQAASSKTEDKENDIFESDETLPAPLPRHRLDHRVAGPIVVAKTRRASVEIGRAFEEKTVTKDYRAIVVGAIKVNELEKVDEISNITTTSSTLSFTITSDVDGKPSETDVEVLRSTPCNINGYLTDLKLFPKTGRKHQLRIHCSNILRTPILGDDLYWNDDNEISVRKRQGLYLYCKKVSLRHPLLRSTTISAEIEEPLRFTRTRTKARKGYEWSRAHAQIPAE